MRKRLRLLISMSALVVLTGAIFWVGKPQPSFGQQNFPEPNRKPACTIFCGDGTMNYVVLAKPPACWGGPLPAAGASNHYKELSKENRKAICANLKAPGRKDTSCPVFKSLIAECDKEEDEPPKTEPTPDPKCEKPTPWFDRSTPCTDVQSPLTEVKGRAVTVTMCGFQIFSAVPQNSDDPNLLETYRRVVQDWIQERVGDKVCCSSMKNASRTGKPCDPAFDIDCDGKPNQSDVNTTYSSEPVPDINLSTSPAGADIDPFPPSLDPNDPNFRPERTGRNSKGVGECDCKWDLIKGDMKCSRNRRQPHVYTATWRCPSTKAEVFTTKRFPGTTPCK